LAQGSSQEEDFDIKENTKYPPAGVNFLSGSLSIKYKPSAIDKDYQH
jgi:hypothetical protein